VHIDDYTLLSNNGLATADITYRIGDTGYTFYVSGTRNFLGEHDASCVVKNPSRQNVTTPYKCEERNTTGADMDAYFVLEPSDAATHTVTNDDQFNRRDMLEAWCAANSTYASCDSLKPSNIDDGLGAFRVTSDTLVNCTTSNSTQSLGYTDGTTTTNTVGTKVEISGKLFGIVQTRLEVSYQHAWAESHSVTKDGDDHGRAGRVRLDRDRPADAKRDRGLSRDVGQPDLRRPERHGQGADDQRQQQRLRHQDRKDRRQGRGLQRQGRSLVPAAFARRPGRRRPVQHRRLGVQPAGAERPEQVARCRPARARPVLRRPQPAVAVHRKPGQRRLLRGSERQQPEAVSRSQRHRRQEHPPVAVSHTDNELWSVTYDPTNKGFRISDKAEPDKALDTEGGKV
jgi:hypothetical protein